jgi:metal-sulfur cluster biosynthetic enzyme
MVMTKVLVEEDAIEVLKKIEDPELKLDLYTLGLIYEIDIKENNNVDIKMTFTSPMCPFGPILLEQVQAGLKGVGFEPNVEIVFEPPWQPSEDVKMMLGLA